MEKTIRINEHWENWSFQDSYIIDPAGNKYTQNDIVAGYWNYKAMRSLTGSKNDISILHQELKRKLNNIEDISIFIKCGKVEKEVRIAL